MAAPALSQLDMNGLEILNARFQNLSANPGSPLEGRYYWNTSTKALRIYNGTVWIELGTGTGTVTSFSAGNLSPLFTTSVATASSTPALTFTLSNAAQNAVFAGPSSGGTGAPTFRSLVQADLPNTVPVSYWAAATANISMGTSFKITNMADPTSAQDAATKAYVDSVAQGLDVKTSVRAATVLAGTLASSFANASVIDGVTLATGDRILIKDQAAPAENGIYTVNASGAPTRATDFDAWSEIPGAFTFVEVGTVNADSGWVCTSDQGGTLGTTAIVFAQFSGAGQITAGNGLTKTGNTLNVGAGSGIQVNADDVQVLVDNSTIEIVTSLRVKDAGVTFAKIASGVWGSTLDTAGSVVNVKGYTFVTNFTVARFRVISQSIVNGSNTITHSLGSADVMVTVLDASSKHVPVIDVTNTNTTTVTIQNDGSTFSGKVLICG